MTRFLEPYLVTGCNGMLGTDLMNALRTSGVEVIGVGSAELDITRRDEVDRSLERFTPGLIINTAAMTNVDGCESATDAAFRVNAQGPENLAESCRAHSCTLMHISTDYVFDGTKGSPYREEDPLNPLGIYGKSKAEGEQRVRNALPDGHCIVRTQWLYGHHGRNFVDAILNQTRKTDVLKVVNDQTGSPTFTVDLANALVELAGRGGRGTFHVTNSGTVTWYGFAEQIIRLAGIGGTRLESITSDTLDRPAPRPTYSVLDTSRYERFIGSPLRDWQDALADYLRVTSS